MAVTFPHTVFHIDSFKSGLVIMHHSRHGGGRINGLIKFYNVLIGRINMVGKRVKSYVFHGRVFNIRAVCNIS